MKVAMDADEDDDLGDASGDNADEHDGSEGDRDHPNADYYVYEHDDAEAGDDGHGSHVNQTMMTRLPIIMTIMPVVKETDPLVLHIPHKMMLK